MAATKELKKPKATSKSNGHGETNGKSIAMKLGVSKKIIAGLRRGYELHAIEYHRYGFDEMDIEVRITDKSAQSMERIALVGYDDSGKKHLAGLEDALKMLNKNGIRIEIPRRPEVDKAFFTSLVVGYHIRAFEIQSNKRITDGALEIMVHEASPVRIAAIELPEIRQ